MWPFNKKEKCMFEIDKDIYTKFCVVTAQKNINEVVETLIKDYIKGSKGNIVSIETTSLVNHFTNDRKSDFKIYLTKIAHKSTGNHYSSSVVNSYSSQINSCGKYYGVDLWKIENVMKMTEFYSKIEKDSYFLQKDKDSNKALSNGLKRYKEFLEYQENQQQ